MLIIIREGNELSPKLKYILKVLNLAEKKILFVEKNNKFIGSQNKNHIQLATSKFGILTYFLLMLLKSPQDIRDGIIRRLFKGNIQHAIISTGFLSILSEVLYNFFGATSRSEQLMSYLKTLKQPKAFIIDEFISSKTLNLRALKKLGPIIYLSQDIAYTRYGFSDNLISKKLMYKLEHETAALANMIVCCSESDRLKYLEMGAKRVIVYPNIYPSQFVHEIKDQTPSITLVLKAHWGPVAKKSLNQIFTALSYIDVKNIKLYLIGISPQTTPKNIKLQHWTSIPSKVDFLRKVSKSWIGINVGIHKGGTNERKYEYAIAGLVVFSDSLGTRGDILPHEYTYLDSHDLAAKLKQVIELGQQQAIKMGIENREQAINLADKYQLIVKEEFALFKEFF